MEARAGATNLDGEFGVVDLDIEMTINRRQKVARIDSSVDGVFASDVGGADDLAGLDAPASEEDGICTGPMVAARLDDAFGSAGLAFAAAGDVADERSAAEFAGDDDQDAFVEAALVDVTLTTPLDNLSSTDEISPPYTAREPSLLMTPNTVDYTLGFSARQIWK